MDPQSAPCAAHGADCDIIAGHAPGNISPGVSEACAASNQSGRRDRLRAEVKKGPLRWQTRRRRSGAPSRAPKAELPACLTRKMDWLCKSGRPAGASGPISAQIGPPLGAGPLCAPLWPTGMSCAPRLAVISPMICARAPRIGHNERRVPDRLSVQSAAAAAYLLHKFDNKPARASASQFPGLIFEIVTMACRAMNKTGPARRGAGFLQHRCAPLYKCNYNPSARRAGRNKETHFQWDWPNQEAGRPIKGLAASGEHHGGGDGRLFSPQARPRLFVCLCLSHCVVALCSVTCAHKSARFNQASL